MRCCCVGDCFFLFINPHRRVQGWRAPRDPDQSQKILGRSCLSSLDKSWVVIVENVFSIERNHVLVMQIDRQDGSDEWVSGDSSHSYFGCSGATNTVPAVFILIYVQRRAHYRYIHCGREELTSLSRLAHAEAPFMKCITKLSLARSIALLLDAQLPRPLSEFRS